MAFAYWTNGEMVEITSHWVGADRDKFLSVSALTGLMPAVETAHQGMLALQRGTATSDYPIVDSNEVLDGRHDHLMRAVNYLHMAYREYLLGQVHLDSNAVQRVKDSKKALLPHGMSGAKVGYVDEAGNAQLAKEAIAKTPAAGHVIGELRLTSTVTGQQVVDEWFAAAAALGDAVHTKDVTAQARDPQGGVKTLAARNSWISVVRTVLAVLDHVGASAETLAALRNPVDQMDAKATARVAAQRPAAQPQPVKPTQ